MVARWNGELGYKILVPFAPEYRKFPVNSVLAGKFGLRDGFAHDSLLQRRVCELSVPTKAQKSWSSRAGPEVRISFPPAGSPSRTCFRTASAGATSGSDER